MPDARVDDLPALTEATSPHFRPIKYSLFPPLGLATSPATCGPPTKWSFDEHVERLRLDDRPDLVVIQVYITSARRSYEIADTYRARGVLRGAGRAARHVAAGRGGGARRQRSSSGPGEDTWPRVPGRPAARSVRSGRYVSTQRTLVGPAAGPPRSDQAAPVPGAELDRGLARLPASLRLLLQGRLLRRRPVVLHADRRRRAGRDRPAARPAPVLPRRPPLRQPPLRRGAVRRHGRHGPALAGGRHGRQSVLAPDLLERAVAAGLRSLFVGFETVNGAQPGRPAQAPERRPRLRGGGPPAARRGRDGQRELRLRHGRRRPGRVRPHRRRGRSRRASRPPRSTS